MCVLCKKHSVLCPNLYRTNFQDGLFISDYVSMFFITSSHFSEVPLKNEPFPLLTVFAKAVVKFVNWGHFKVLACLSSRYSKLCEAILGGELCSYCKELYRENKIVLFLNNDKGLGIVKVKWTIHELVGSTYQFLQKINK